MPTRMALPVFPIGVRAIRVADGLGAAVTCGSFLVAQAHVTTATRMARTLIVCGARDLTPLQCPTHRTGRGSPPVTHNDP